MKAYKTMLLTGRWIWQRKRIYYLYPMRVKLSDKDWVIEADGFKDLVTKMRELSFGRPKDNREYMKEYARRAVLYDNTDIRSTNEKDFIDDLITVGHISVL